MIVQPSQMQTVVDSYKLDQMTDNTPEITRTCLAAAESKVLSYLAARYDVAAIASKPSTDPSMADLCEIIKDVALYYIIRRHNIDLAYKSVVDIYQEHMRYLEHVAKATISLVGLPLRTDDNGRTSASIAMGSRPKRDYDY